MLKIRLSLKGYKKHPFYNIIIINSKKSRNSNYIEKIGFINPINKNYKININRYKYWISKGAIALYRIKNIIKFHIKNQNKNKIWKN